MMQQATALAITCVKSLVFENRTEKCIRPVLEEFALIRNPAEHTMARQLQPRAGLVREHPRPMVEWAATMGGTLILIDSVRAVTSVADCAIGKDVTNSRHRNRKSLSFHILTLNCAACGDSPGTTGTEILRSSLQKSICSQSLG